MGDERCTREAGLDVVATLGHQLVKSVSSDLLIVRIEQPENDGQRVRCLGIAMDDAFVPDVVVVECGSGAFGKSAEVLSILLTAKKRCGVSHDARVSVEAGRRNHAVIGPAQARLLRGGSGIKPIAELESLVPQSCGGEHGFDASHVGRHRVELISKHLPIPICPPKRPRHPDRGVAPDRGGIRDRPMLGTIEVLQHVRHNRRHAAICRLLFCSKVLEPVPKEIVHIEKASGSGCENSDVTRPAETFVTLRTIGGHVEEIPAEAPHDIAVQLVDQLVGAFELAGAPQLRMNHHGSQCALSLSKGVSASWPAIHLDITETVEGECWLEYVVVAAENEAVGGFGGSEWSRAQFVVFEYFGVPQRDRCTGRALHMGLHPPHQVLPEIDQGLAGWGGPDLDRSKLFLSAGGGTDVGSQSAEVEFGRVYAGPRLIGKAAF